MPTTQDVYLDNRKKMGDMCSVEQEIPHRSAVRSSSFIFIGGAILAIAAIIGGFLLGRSRGPANDFIEVRRGEIAQEVIVTGQVEPAERLDLGFEKSGKVAWVSATVGDRVRAGQALVGLANADLLAELAEVEAKVKAEQAQLDQLRRGTRPEELSVSEAKVLEARQDLIADLTDAYTKADDAIRVKVDQFISNPRTTNPQLNFTVTEPVLEQKIESDRRLIETLLVSWAESLPGLGTLSSDLHAAAVGTGGNLSGLREFLDAVVLGLSTLAPSGSLTQTTIDTYRSAVSTARTNANAAASAVAAADAKLTIQERELLLARAGSTGEDIRAQEAAVAQAEAAVKKIQAELARTVIRAPASGLITAIEADVGEIVAANTSVVSLISDTAFEIKANVPEVDIGAIMVGNPVSIRLDAFPSQEFHGTVVAIDPAETVIEGVVNFEITVALEKSDQRLKSGLTANLTIETLKKSDVLVLPQVAILERDQGTFVRKLASGEAVETAVKLGIRGRDGRVEVVAGLAEGDRVLNVGQKTSR